MNSIVTFSDVSFELPNGRPLLSDLSFSLDPKITALVGPNGVGKTTLARLIAGELRPSRGEIRRNGATRFFRQLEAPKPISVAAYLAAAYDWSLLGENLLRGIESSTLCTQLSGGEWMRLRLACAIGDAYIILDEPTNDLDRAGRDVLLLFLKNTKCGALLISHDREALELCDEVLEFSNQGFTKFGGRWDEYEIAKGRERANLKNALESTKRNRDAQKARRIEQIDRQDKRNRRGAKVAARGGMPKILIGARKRQAQTTTASLDVATLARANAAVSESFAAYRALKVDPIMYADLSGPEIPKQKLVAEAYNFNIKFQKWLYRNDLDFSWRGSVRVALKGPNGSGKSTLLKSILGGDFETRGELRSGSLNSLYIDQRCASLDDSKSVIESVREVSIGDESDLRNGLAKFLFVGAAVFQQVSSLSGGERLRAALAKGMLGTEKPELLILDEPTNNLDLPNIEFLENLVRQFQGALLIISHDEVFLKNCGVVESLDLS